MIDRSRDRRQVAAKLADHVCSFEKARVGAEMAARACAHVADTLAVTLAGAGAEAPQVMRAALGTGLSGTALVFGTALRAGTLDAALINATAAHALDLDDVSSAIGGHPSAPLVAPLFAVAEERGLSGEAILAGYVVGLEVETRLARAVHLHHYDKGWHPTATLGVFGAAAATAHLIGLDRAQTTTALAIAASSASGIKANFGTMTKALHVGRCARDGLMAALLAERGFTASAAALEHEQGFFNVFNGPDTYDMEPLLAEWTELAIAGSGLGFKQYACCRSAQPAIAVALEIAATSGFAPDAVARVDVRLPARGLRHTNNPDPHTALEAKFSVQYAVARALASGAVRLEDFEGDAVGDSRVQRLLKVTHAAPHPGMSARGPEDWAAEVIVTTHDGSRIVRSVDKPAAEIVMTAAELQAKFHACAGRAIPATQAETLYEKLCDLGSVTDIRSLTPLLTSRP